MRRPVALAGVVVGAAGVGAALTGLYLGMRDVMVDNGGYCASGGPYQVAQGHECGGRTWVLFAAPFVGLALVALLIAASDSWSNGRVSGLGALVWGGMFGALGWNFLDLGIHPPASVGHSGADASWLVCAGVFWLMALGGISYGLIAIRDYFRPADSVSPPVPMPPIVRATVSGARPGAALLGTRILDATADALAPDETPAGNAWVWLLSTAGTMALAAYVVTVLW